MSSVLEIMRQLSTMDATGWSLVGLEADGPGWRRYMRDDEHPRFMRQYRKLRNQLFEDEETATWH